MTSLSSAEEGVEESDLRQRVRLRLEHGLADRAAAARIDRFRGCLLGGAIGDALGAPVEFMSHRQIVATFGSSGVIGFEPAYGRIGAITDDTQMTLFTGEGLLRAVVRMRLRGIGPVFAAVTDHAYARWMITQGETPGVHPRPSNGTLVAHQELFHRRAPGNTCLDALRSKVRAGDAASNDSKGCGGVMRVAPVGLLYASQAHVVDGGDRDERTFELGCEIAGLTHGHATGRLPAGYLAVLIAVLAAGGSWDEATTRAWAPLVLADRHEETSALIEQALVSAAEAPFAIDRLVGLGAGWIAEEALAMSLYCVVTALPGLNDPSSIRAALRHAVNHGGDSDSTGSITGNILGALVGESRLPAEWLEALELREVIADQGEDFATLPVWDVGDDVDSAEGRYWMQRYPGG